MRKNYLKILLLLILGVSANAQSDNYAVANIDASIKENANAVIRLKQKNIAISSRKSMAITSKNVVTIFNEKGLPSTGASEYFDKSTKVKSIEAVVLNASGKEIKRIKRKDFKETSVSEGSMITDNKIIYLDYTPTEYPFTLVYQSEVETSNTAFIPTWNPIERSYEGIEKSLISVSSLNGLGFKYKDFNISNSNILKEEKPDGVSFIATNLAPTKNEDFSPSYRSFMPHVLFGLKSFNLEGVEGTSSSWKEFGSWVYSSLLAGTDEIPLATQEKIKSLVGEEKDPIKIAKIVYQYVQNKTRYISIQLGIGGWKPMLARDVDRLGYGDCKALTNYTRALLKTAGVNSYYTIIHGDSQKRDLHEDFVSMQGNHVILAIPANEKIYWLECTSQTSPFGFQGSFTDNRTALLIKPEGGQILKTHEYATAENTQISTGSFAVDESGSISGSVFIKSKGTQYGSKSENASKSADQMNKHYKDYFSHINNLKLKKINLSDNKDDIEFSESITIEASEYAKKTGNKLIFALNAYNPNNYVPQRYRTRMNPFEISRGFSDYDEITIELPKGFTIEAMPENFEIKNNFGFYKTEYIVLNENQLLYKRTFQTNSGNYDKSEYENFRKFREQVSKNDNAKIALAKN